VRTATTRSRRTALALSLAISLGLGVLVVTTDSAQAATSGYQAKAKKVALSNPMDLIATNDKVYVTDGNAVNVY
jgi:hypothetical protein